MAHNENRRRGRANKIIALILLGLFGLFSILFSATPQRAQALTAASNLNFQGRLLNAAGAVVPDGNYNIDFKIYNADSTTGSVGTCTGACLWEETHLVASTQGVSVVNGYFSVSLGSITAFASTINWDQQLYLTMNVTTTGTVSCSPATSCTWNGEMQNAGHSIALTAVPLAFRANQLAVAGANEQVIQFANSTFGQTTTINVQDPGATTANICYETSGGAVSHTCAAATGGSGYIQNSTGGPQSANFNIISSAAGSIGGVIHANASQSVDIFDVQNSGTTNLFSVGKDGLVTVSPLATSSGSALTINTGATGNAGLTIKGVSSQTGNLQQIQDSTGANLKTVDAAGNEENGAGGYINTAYGGLGAYSNLLQQSEALLTAPWATTGTTTGSASNDGTNLAPDGSATAEKLVAASSGASFDQTSGTAPTNANYTFSVWLKTSAGTAASQLRIDGATTGTGTASAALNVTTTWQRFFVTQNPNGFTGNIKVRLFPGGTGGTATVYAWGAQLALSSTPKVYVGTGGSTMAAATGLVVNGNGIFTPQADSTGAVQIQNAASTNTLFKADTSNNRVIIGDADNSSSANSTLLVVDSGSTANRPTAVNGGIFYDSQIGHFVVVEGGSYKVLCNQTDAACGSGGGSTTTLNQAYTNGAAAADQTLTLTSADGGGVLLKDSNVSGTLFQVQNASSNQIFTVEDSGNSVILGRSNGASGLTGKLTFANAANNNTFTFQAGTTGSNLTYTLPTSDAGAGNVACLQTTGGTGVLTFGDCSGTGGGGAGNANRQLSNLSGVAVNASLTPGTSNSIDLGDGTHLWANAYLGTALYTPYLDAQSANGVLNIGTTNAGAITVGNVTNSTVTVKTKSSATAFQVQDASGNGILTVNSTTPQVLLGKAGTGGINGLLTLNTATAGSFTVGIQSSGSTTASYNLTLPTALPGSNSCIQSNTSGVLSFVSCGAGATTTLSQAYTNGSAAGDQTLLLTSGDGGGLKIQDASGGLGTDLFDVQNFGGGTTYLGVSATTISTADNLTFTAAAGATISTNGASGDLTVQAIGTSTLTLNTGGAGTVNLGTANTTTIGIGSTSSVTTIQGSSAAGGIAIGNTNAVHGIQIGAGGTSTAQTIVIGSTGSTSATTIEGSNTGINIGTATTAHTINIGTGGTNTQAINIGSINGSSSVTLQGGTTGTTISLQAGTGGTIAIGTANGNTVNIGGNVSNTPVNITSGGTGNITLTSNSATTGTIIMSGTNSTTAFQVQNSGGAQLLNIDSANNVISLLGNASGQLGAWVTNSNPLPGARSQPQTVVANGYIYVIGGYSGVGASPTSTVYYAKLNTDGSIGTWTTAVNSLPNVRVGHSSVSANGYLYAIGGSDGSGTAQTTVYYAKLNTDGSIGNWQTNANNLPSARTGQQSITANGYVYIIDGRDSSGTNTGTTYYAKLNADGSTGAWTLSTNTTPVVLINQKVVMANGYVYVIGGMNASSTAQTAVYYAKLNSDGSISSWTTNANPLPTGRRLPGVIVSNGYLYVMGGGDTSGSPIYSSIYFAKLNADGSTGTWSTATNSLPAVRWQQGSVVSDGYVYAVGGGNDNVDTSQSTVYYASTTRVQIGANLDLVGLQGQTLADGGDGSTGSTGGSITAGNIQAVGTLQVQGQASFSQSVSVAGNLNASGVAIQATSDTTSAFLIGDKKGSDVINVSAVANGNLLNDGNFEGSSVNPSWAALNGATLSAVSTIKTFGSQSLQAVLNAANASDGVKYVYPFKPNTTYSLSVYAAITSGSTATFEMGTVQNGGAQTNCGVTGVTLTATETRYTCTFTTGATIQATDFFYFKRTTAAAGTLAFDGAQLEYGSLTNYGDPGLVLQNLINNPSFEGGNINGWLAKPTITTLAQSTDFAQFGSYSEKLVTSTNASNRGAAYQYPFLANTQYSFSVWLRTDTGTTSNVFALGRQENGSDVDCLTAQTITATWTNFTCTFTTGGTVDPVNSNIYVKVPSTFITSSYNIYIDGVTFTQGGSPLAYTTPAENIEVNSYLNNLTLNSGSNGEIQPWKQNAAQSTAASSGINECALNGYIYKVDNGSSDDYWKINADGSLTKAGTVPDPDATLGSMKCVAINGYIYAMGGSPSPSYVYSARPNPVDGSISSWIRLNQLPTPLASGTVLTANGYIYVIGGDNGTTAQSFIYIAKANADGTIGAWTSSTVTLASTNGPGVDTRITGVIANNFLYVIGGDDGTTPKTTVSYIGLNKDGTLAGPNWTVGTALPQVRSNARAVVSNGYIYVIGGSTTNAFTGGVSTVLFAKQNSDGSLGTWNYSANPLPTGRSSHGVVTSNGYIYVIDGRDTGSTSRTSIYYTSTARTQIAGGLDLLGLNGQSLTGGGDFSLGSTGGFLTAGNTQIVGTLQVQGASSFAQGLSVNGSLTVSGSSSAFINNGLLAGWNINSFDLGCATAGCGSPVIRGNDVTVTVNGYIYLIGGTADGTTAQNTVYYAKLNTDGSTGAWATTASLPAVRFFLGGAAANGYIYAVGGNDGTNSQSTVYYGKVNADGTIGSWLTNSYDIGCATPGCGSPAPRDRMPVLVIKNHLYVFGGANNGTLSSTVYTSQLNTDGSTGVWSTTSSLPTSGPAVLDRQTATVSGGYVYLFGGYIGSGTTAETAVDYAKINSDASLGTWTREATNPLPAGRYFATSASSNGYVYVVAGKDSSGTVQSTVYYAQPNSDGSMGTWSTDTANPLPAARYLAGDSVLVNGYMYVIGGTNGTSYQSSVYYGSLPRLSLGTNLDLVGQQNGSLNDAASVGFGSTGGSITAGDITAIGNLQIQGQGSFAQGLMVSGSVGIASSGVGNTALSIDDSTTGINLLQVKDLSQNFGSAVTGGAFISRNSYFGEEFNSGHNTTCTTPSTAGNGVNSYARGDYGNSGSATTCTAAGANIGAGELNFSHVLGAAAGACVGQTVTGLNGVERIQDTGSATASSTENCVENLAATTTTSNKIYLAANLPVVTIKVKATTLQNSASDRIQIGMVSSDSANTLGTNSPTQSIYFTNCSTWNNGAAPTGCGTTTWYGVTSTTGVGAATVVTCNTGSGSLTANFSYLRIEVRSSSDVHFFADYNASNGITETECGNGSSTNITSSAMTPWMQVMHLTNAATNNQLDIDYFRSWQDDNVNPSTAPNGTSQSSTNTAPDGSQLVTEAPLTPDPDQPDPNVSGSFFNFLGATSEDTVINGNLFVHGTIYADKIKANEIEGLSIFTDQLDSLTAQLNAVKAASTTTISGSGTASSGSAESSDASNGVLTLNIGASGLTVGGDANFQGNVFFYKLVTFVQKTIFNEDVTFNGHITTGGTAPTINLESAAGLSVDPQDGQTHSVAKDTISGNDNSGKLSVTIGDNATPGEILNVSFNKQFSGAPSVFLTPTNQSAAGLKYYVTSTTDGFRITILDTPTSGATFNFNYLVIQ